MKDSCSPFEEFYDPVVCFLFCLFPYCGKNGHMRLTFCGNGPVHKCDGRRLSRLDSARLRAWGEDDGTLRVKLERVGVRTHAENNAGNA